MPQIVIDARDVHTFIFLRAKLTVHMKCSYKNDVFNLVMLLSHIIPIYYIIWYNNTRRVLVLVVVYIILKCGVRFYYT